MITDDLVNPPVAEEVVLSPDGQTAVVRQFGATSLVHVDLLSQHTTPLDVGTNPTDLDITPDGSALVAVARGSSELWVYDLTIRSWVRPSSPCQTTRSSVRSS